MAGRNGKRIGIALGDREMVGVLLGKKSAPSARVPVSLDLDGAWAGGELRRAFGELKVGLEKALGVNTDGASVHVALLPPLADARLVSFPPMRKAEVEAVLARDVARYFLGANRPHVVGVRLPRGSRSRSGKDGGVSLEVLATASPLGLLELARSALEEVGWRASSFAAAHAAWMEAAYASKGFPPETMVAVVGPTAHLLRLKDGDPVSVRQLSSAEPHELAAALKGGSGKVLVLANPQTFEELRAALASVGLTASRDRDGWPGVGEGTAGRASTAFPELLPPTLARERREKGRKAAFRLAGAAAVLVLATLGAQLMGAHRELESVRDRRAAIRPEVAPLLSVRDSVNTLAAQIQSIAELSENSPVWTRSLVELAALLPEDTYLTAFFASGDTVELEAAGAQAGPAIQALREAGLFQEVRLLGLVERELEDGETVVERFKLWARMPPMAGEGEGS